MATDKELENEREITRLKNEQRILDAQAKGASQDSIDLSSAYVDSVKEALGINVRRSTFDSNLLKVNKDINRALVTSKAEYRSINDLTKDIAKNNDLIAQAQKSSQSILDSLSDPSREQVEAADHQLDVLKSFIDERELLLNSAAEGNELDEKQLKSLDEQIHSRETQVDLLEKGLSSLQRQALFTSQNTKQLEKEQNILKTIKNEAGGANILQGFFGKFGLKDSASDAYAETIKGLRAKAKKEKIGIGDKSEISAFGKRFNSLKNAIGKGFVGMGRFALAFGKILLKALGPWGLVLYIGQQIFDIIAKVDGAITDVAKATASTKEEAKDFRQELSNSAKLSNELFVTGTKLLEAFSSLNKQFGFITKFSSDTLVSVVKLTDKVGIAADSAGNLAAASELTGTSLDSNFKSVLSTSYELQRQTGIQFDLREITNEVGKTTGVIRANLAANPAELSKAVTQSKLLGSNLNDVASASRSFLEFESSIQNELEAELLLNRDLNLERARAAALQGDYATVAKEVTKQAGDFATFGKLNVIQQDALAKSLGFTSDQLADVLFQQEIQGKSAQQLRALGKEELADRLEATTAQQKFNAAVDKLKDIFADVATAILPLIDVLSTVFQILEPIFYVIGQINKGIVSLFSGVSSDISNIDTSASGVTKTLDKVVNKSKQVGNNVSNKINQTIKSTEELQKEGKEYLTQKYNEGNEFVQGKIEEYKPAVIRKIQSIKDEYQYQKENIPQVANDVLNTAINDLSNQLKANTNATTKSNSAPKPVNLDVIGLISKTATTQVTIQ